MATTGKYIPPSRRAGYVPSPSSLPPSWKTPVITDPNHHPVQDLSKHFTHPQDSSLTFFSFPIPSGELQSDSTRLPEETPLPDSLPAPHPLGHLVSYIIVFPNAHPAWESENELWMHTNADILINDWDEGRRNFGRPIPVFNSVNPTKDVVSSKGWWCIDRLEIVEPQSDELKRILQLKDQAKSYGRPGRTKMAWKRSLDQRWIKLKLSRAPTSTENYTELKDVMSLRGGEGGEVERYLLDIGGLKEEINKL